MAQIINRDSVASTDLTSSLITDFQTLFTFDSVNLETKTLYITSELYMKFSDIVSNTLTITFGNNNGDLYAMTFTNVSSSYSHYYQMIKSTSGDVALRLQTRNPLTDNNYFQFAIVRVKDSSNNQSWGIFSPANNISTSTTPPSQAMIANVFGNIMLLCEDNVRVGTNAVLSNASNTSATTPSTFNIGFNSNAEYTHLSDIFNMYSKYTTVNFKMTAITPQPYNRVCTFGTDKYYCISFFAMLDNDLT